MQRLSSHTHTHTHTHTHMPASMHVYWACGNYVRINLGILIADAILELLFLGIIEYKINKNNEGII